MRLLILERDHALYAALLMAADPSLKVVAGDDPLQLIDAASECSIWLGQPDLVAQMLRQGVHPVWVQSTWAGITPLLAADLPKDYSLTRAVGIFGQVMSEYLLTYMLAHERQFLGRLASQVGSQWDSRTPGGLRGRQVVIVGTGEIGQAVAHTLSGFGMDLTGVAKNPRSLVPFNRMGSLDDLGRLVETADYLINLLCFGGISAPPFWLALLLISLFAVKLGWLPAGGMADIRPGTPWTSALADQLRHLALPVLTLTLVQLGGYTRFMRGAMIEALRQDYVRTARAKGAPERLVLWRHAFANALSPVLTILALSFGGLVSGALITETMFAWPGMGKAIYQAILENDYNLALVGLLVATAATIAGNLLADLAYAWVDPRVSLAEVAP